MTGDVDKVLDKVMILKEDGVLANLVHWQEFWVDYEGHSLGQSICKTISVSSKVIERVRSSLHRAAFGFARESL